MKHYFGSAFFGSVKKLVFIWADELVDWGVDWRLPRKASGKD